MPNQFLLHTCCFALKQGVKLMVVAARSTDKTQSNVRAKLLFLGGLIAKGNAKAEKALEVGDKRDKERGRKEQLVSSFAF